MEAHQEEDTHETKAYVVPEAVGVRVDTKLKAPRKSILSVTGWIATKTSNVCRARSRDSHASFR